MKGKTKAPASKSSKATIARRNAEALKAKKKAIRMTKAAGSIAPSGKKGKSGVAQSKNAKRR